MVDTYLILIFDEVPALRPAEIAAITVTHHQVADSQTVNQLHTRLANTLFPPYSRNGYHSMHRHVISTYVHNKRFPRVHARMPAQV